MSYSDDFNTKYRKIRIQVRFMKKTSVMLDQKTRALIDEYCHETSTKISDAFRNLFTMESLVTNVKKNAGLSKMESSQLTV